MTDTPVPDAAVEIAMVAIGYGRHEHARTVVAALARDGWLHDPAEIERLRLENRRLRMRLDEMDIRAGEVLDSPVVDGRSSVRPEHVEALRATMARPLDREEMPR
jgi:hypothetical protein